MPFAAGDDRPLAKLADPLHAEATRALRQPDRQCLSQLCVRTVE